jgi:hypothetical protein
MENIPGNEPTIGADTFTAECLYLSRLFFRIRDRKERLRIIALAEATIRSQTSQADPDAETH